MKGLAVFLVVLMASSIFVPCGIVSAESSFVPHEDPAVAQSVFDSFSFFSEYANLFALMVSKDYNNASKIGMQLSQINLPSDLRSLINRYNNLTQQLIQVLSNLENSLNEASNLLYEYKVTEAGQVLNQAGVLVAQAQILLGDLQDASATLSQRLGVFATATGSKLRDAYNQLQAVMQRLSDLIDEYHLLLQRTNQRLQEITSENLKSTTLTLNLNATQVFVGSYVDASGTLFSNSSTLANRVVTIYLDDANVATAKTQTDGSYHVSFQVPYSYVSSASVSAGYAPVGADNGVYLGAVSRTINLNIIYYKTHLGISSRSVAYPGLSYSVQGNVTSQNGEQLAGRQVSVLLDGGIIGQTESNQTGAFLVVSKIASGAKLGVHVLTVEVDSVGLFAGVSFPKNITVQQLATHIEVNTAGFILLPTQLQINGNIKSGSIPLNNTRILASFANVSATVQTTTDGTFTLKLDVPFDSAFAGFQDLKVTAQPAETWYADAQATATIFVLNWVGIGFALASLMAVLFVLYLRLIKDRGKKAAKENEQVASFEASQKEDADTSAVAEVPIQKYGGLKGKVLNSYIDALQSVQSVTGELLKQNMTIREYLNLTRAKLSGANAPFSELTLLAERSLYSPHGPTDEDVKLAEDSAANVRRILNGVA